MPEMGEDSWLRTANDFYQKTQFPNCIGAIDGKHIRVRKPQDSGSLFFNYKSFFSIVLLGIVDANYCFISVDIGSYGSCSDSYAFKNSNFGQRLEMNQLKLPKRAQLPGDRLGQEMPFVLVGDEAFALSRHVLRPYARKNLTTAKRIFNYRLTRARRMVECTFGILANKWRIFHRPIDVNPEFCDNIIKACCVLHNFVRQRDGVSFDDTLYECPLENINPSRVRPASSAVSVREYFTEYFTSAEDSIPWQYDRL